MEADDLTTGYLFKTREGIRGIMAFAGFARKPCRVKLRYKFAEGDNRASGIAVGLGVELLPEKLDKDRSISAAR